MKKDDDPAPNFVTGDSFPDGMMLLLEKLEILETDDPEDADVLNSLTVPSTLDSFQSVVDAPADDMDDFRIRIIFSLRAEDGTLHGFPFVITPACVRGPRPTNKEPPVYHKFIAEVRMLALAHSPTTKGES